jgi:NAD-dependent dihydropyrimidine dehydrogenase PreA subunit
MKGQNYLKGIVSLAYDSSKCIGCRLCVEVCPHEVFMMDGKIALLVNIDNCMECGACEINCEPGAIRVNSGVGCASAYIYGFLNKTEPNCDCSGGSSSCC